MNANATGLMPPHPAATPSLRLGAEAALPPVDARENACASGVHRIEEGRGAPPYPAKPPAGASAAPVFEPVTLIVYGWKNVDPGTLSWVFPSADAALIAARAMTNAVRWAVVAESPPHDGVIVDVATARANGTVLVEQ